MPIHIHMHIYIQICTYDSWLGDTFTFLMSIITMLNLKLGSAAIKDEWVLNDPMEQIRLILDKIKLHKWSPI